MQILSNYHSTCMNSWEINRGQYVDTFWCDVPTGVHRPANILKADHIKDERPSMRLLTRDSNLYLIMVILNYFASKALATINGDICFSMHSGGKLNLGLLSSFSESLQC